MNYQKSVRKKTLTYIDWDDRLGIFKNKNGPQSEKTKKNHQAKYFVYTS